MPAHYPERRAVPSSFPGAPTHPACYPAHRPHSSPRAPMPIDVAQLRRDTPGVRDHIHLNSAGAALVSRQVLAAQIGHLELEARVGGYQAARDVAPQVQQVRVSLGRLLGASADEIALLTSATDAWNTIFLALVDTLPRGARILADRALYGSHAITLLHTCQRLGCTLEVVDDNPNGELCLDDLDRRLQRPAAALACLTHMPTSSGLVNPIEAAGERCARAGVPLLLDACQSVGQWPVDVRRLRCVALAGTGRKYLRAPRGTGFLFVRRHAIEGLLPLAPDLQGATWTSDTTFTLQGDARRFERWEQSIAGFLGLGVATDHALEMGILAIRHRISELSAGLRDRLRDIPGITVHDRGPSLSGICTFTCQDTPATTTAATLQAHGIRVSVSQVTSGRLDLQAKGVDAVVRASVHAYNTSEELDQLCAILRGASR